MLQVKRFLPSRAQKVAAIGLAIGTNSIAWGIVGKAGWTERGRVDFVATRLTDQDFARMVGECLDQVPDDFAGGRAAVHGLSVVVADRWLAHVVLPWSDGLLGSAGAEAYARSQLHGAGFADDANQVVRIDSAPYGQPRLAFAYGAAMIAVLEAFAKRLGVRLASIMPLSVSGWEFAQRRSPKAVHALGLVMDADVAVIGNVEAASGSAYPSSFHIRPRSESAGGHAELAQLWDRLCIRQPQWAAVAEPSLLHLAGFAEPGDRPVEPFKPVPAGTDVRVAPGELLAGRAGAWRHALDAVQRGAPLGPGRAALFVLVVLAAALAGAAAVRSSWALTEAQARHESLASAPARAPAKAPSREELARIKAVNTAIRELNLPIEALLRSLEPPQDMQVAVLNVQTSAQAGEGGSGLKIAGQALSSADMARYVAYVSAREPFTGAFLTRHEEIREAGEVQYRFTVEARWKD